MCSHCKWEESYRLLLLPAFSILLASQLTQRRFYDPLLVSIYRLETLYSSFDNAAKRRRVFKVETIGDCYVAVCGLPEPRKDHATVMARFATDCMVLVGKKLAYLQTTLGGDTINLGFRVGLHSGAVTVGYAYLLLPVALHQMWVPIGGLTYCCFFVMMSGWRFERRSRSIPIVW